MPKPKTKTKTATKKSAPLIESSLAKRCKSFTALVDGLGVDEEKLAEIDTLIARAAKLKVITEKNRELASEIARELAKKIKDVKASRSELTGPLETFKKKLIELEKKMVNRLEPAKVELATRALRYDEQLEQKRLAALEEENRLTHEANERRREERAELLATGQVQVGQPSNPTEVLASVPRVHIPAKPKGQGISSRPKYELVIDDLDSIPMLVAGRRLWVLDEAAVKQAIIDKIVVPGAHVLESRTPSVRSA